MQIRPPRRTTTPLLLAATALITGTALAGCSPSSDNGQAAALESCRHFGLALSSALTPPARTQELATAQQQADRAVRHGARWQSLADGLKIFDAAVQANGGRVPVSRPGTTASSTTSSSGGSGVSTADARAAIDGACNVASRGY